MASNYPPGVTGNEYAIAGPDYERESEELCGECGGETMEQGYGGYLWLFCMICGQTADIDLPESDPDRKYDEERDRRMLGIDRPDELENTSE